MPLALSLYLIFVPPESIQEAGEYLLFCWLLKRWKTEGTDQGGGDYAVGEIMELR